eukprot:scaffold55927_cov63-Phaeocystis_antarctica.AAC.3
MRREGLRPHACRLASEPATCRRCSLGLGWRVPIEAKAPVNSHRATADLGPKRGCQAGRQLGRESRRRNDHAACIASAGSGGGLRRRRLRRCRL